MNTADQAEAHSYLERIIKHNNDLEKDVTRLEMALKMITGEDKDILLKAIKRIQDNKATAANPSYGALSAQQHAQWAQAEMARARQGMIMDRADLVDNINRTVMAGKIK